jgi:hypothetical protein
MSLRELREMEVLMARNGYDPRDAKKLQKEGIGPTELEHRLRYSGIGSLEYTHGFYRLRRNPSKRNKMTRKNPWPKKYKSLGKKYDDCLDSIQPGYNPYAVCGAAFSKKYGKRFGDMLSAKRRMNPGPVPRETSDEARELSLFAENDEPLYRRMVKPIEKNLARKIKKGTYDSKMALKAWEYLAEAAAKKYVKEFGGGSWFQIFPPSARREMARDWRDAFEAEVQAEGLERFLK